MSIRFKMFLGFVVVAALGVFLGVSFMQSGGAVSTLEIVYGTVILVLAVLVSHRLSKKAQFHECILDAIPFPISVTDKKRKWIFVNSAVEGMLKKTRGQLYGKPCSNWGAAICDTDNCGINCLYNGKHMTFFNQAGMDFKVHLGYLKVKTGKTIGHLELVEDMTDIFKRQKAEKKMTSAISQSIVELSENTSDVATKTTANSELASKAASLTGSMKKNADKGSVQMTHMIAAVQEIKESAQTISRVINTINDIAFQTNLLALNASVEAARAGEAGKGFAVVADEVRHLATRSAQAANDTNNIIRTSIEKSELGYRIAGETAISLTEILNGLTSANKIVSDIARSSEDQSTAIQNINSSLQEVSEVIQRSRGEEIEMMEENN